MPVTFTDEEVAAIFDTVDQLSGCDAYNVFAWDGSDDINSPTISAFVKIFKATNRNIPDNLSGLPEEL